MNKHHFVLLILLWAVQGFGQLVDVAIEAEAVPSQVAVGETVDISIRIINEMNSDLTGLTVQVDPFQGAIYDSHLASSGTLFDPGTGIWLIGDVMDASVETLELNLKVVAGMEGIIFSQVQVLTMVEIDVDSEAGNNLPLEDDHQSVCASVPHKICTAEGESIALEAPLGLPNYEWYLDDGTNYELVSNEQTYIATQPGSYHFSTGLSACSVCCPVILEEECDNINPPVANADSDSTGVNIPVDIFVLDNDEAGDSPIDTNSITITDPTSNGDVVINDDGSITYTPGTDFFGIDTFIYEICHQDVPPLCDTALVIVEVGDLVFDLALEKTLVPGQDYDVDIGDEVSYFITVTNEGAFAASEIELVDHIPAGLELSPDAIGWTLNPNGDAYYTYDQTLAPGETVSIEIILTVVYGASNQVITNVAEVTQVTDSNGIPAMDVDSTPNNGNSDEDDIDEQQIQLIPHDPTGWIYCDKTGKIITGGAITVEGPGEVFIIQDGSTGYYEFFTDGTPGIYNLTYNHPDGYPMSIDCLPESGAFDPTGLPGPVVLGSDADGDVLADTTCVANPFYLEFDIEPGDPIIFNNNIPIRCSFIGSIVCVDTDGDELPNPGEPGLSGITVSLFDCADTLNPIMTIVSDVDGAFSFDGLPAGDYMLHFETPADHRLIQNSMLNEDGFSDCITLNPGECDTTTTACFYPCPVVDAGDDLFLCVGDTAQLMADIVYGEGQFIWSPSTDLQNADTQNPMLIASEDMMLYVTYDDGLGCATTDSLYVEVHTQCLPDIIEDDSVTISTNCDFGDPLYCFNVPFDELGQYSFELNGQPFDPEFGPCDYLKGRYYTYGALLGFGDEGPYELEYWSVAGVMYTAEFQNMDELVDLMNQWDPLGQWEHNPDTRTIFGGIRQTFYGKLYIRQTDTGTLAILDMYELFNQNSSYVILPEGEHTLVVNHIDGATDTVFIKAACVTPDYVDISIPVGASDTICLSTTELEGDVVAIFDPCLPGFDEPAELTLIEGTNCVEAFGMYIGQTGGCYVICDEFGICDTTYISVNVYDEGFVVLPDSLCTPKDMPVVREVLNNDQIPGDIASVNILTPPQNGTVVVNPDFTVTYTPNPGYCNDEDNTPLDQFVYEVCTSFECQSTVVFVTVKCDGLVVYNGFSPNGDGVNDTFKIDGLNAFENHNLMVFNRWGNKVFESKNYQNDWDGFWDSQRLPVGTYFYLIELNGGEQVLSGYLQIWW